jgi:energy-coupling factor transporter ATP-binding protein EcfA2
VARKAESLQDIFNIFEPKALTDDQKEFYQPTAAVRDGGSLEFHDSLFERVKMSTENSRILVIGHGGCGKSTELRMLAWKLREEGMPPIIIEARDNFNLNDFSIIDIFVSIVEHLAKYAINEDIGVDGKIISIFQKALSTKSTNEYLEKKAEVVSESSASASVGLAGFLQFMSKIAFSLKMGSGLKEDFRREIKPKLSEIIETVNALVYDLNYRISERRNSSDSETENRSNIVIIIDGLEKCRQECVRKLFAEDVSSLSEIKTHLVVACPIYVFRSSDGGNLQSYFLSQEVMPMIKTHNMEDLSPYRKGINVIKELILRRADNSFFEDGVLEKIITKAGGSLRDTCYLLSESAFEAHLRKREKVDEDSVDFVLNKFAAEVFLRVSIKYYQTIRDICDGDHEVRNEEDLAELLYAGAVFEYNGKKWVDLHPLIRDYIVDHPTVLN